MTTISMVCWDIEGEEEKSRKAEGDCGEERGGRGLSIRFEKRWGEVANL
jgi:hypothetical protein